MVQTKTKIMGVINVTPDSFFDGGKFSQVDRAVEQAMEMIASGVDIIDIGGESTRPGASEVSAKQEIERVIPVIEGIRKQSNTQISIDTSKPEVMKAALLAGANIINDVRALQEPGAVDVAAEFQAPVCLMHMLGEPRTMQENPAYSDVVSDVKNFLLERIGVCEAAGISSDQIWLDPGFGFGKTLSHNLSLLKHLDQFVSMGYPVLVGMSRKSMLGGILDVPVEERLAGSLALASIAAMKGATIIRVHDVKESKQVIMVCEAVLAAQ